MPAIEVRSGKYMMVKENPPGSGNYSIQVTKTLAGEFVIPIQSTTGGEDVYVQKAVGPGSGWVVPLIEHRDGNGLVPIEKKS